eukprot:1130756_1
MRRQFGQRAALTIPMGCCSSDLRHEFMILMLGLDAAGKTDILYRSLLQKKNFPLHTFGNVFNAEPVLIEDTNLIVWEVAGQESIRRLWMHYYPVTQGLIYVIDSQDKERIEEARDALFNMVLSHPLIDKHTNIPLLILCNKQDLPHAMSSDEICICLDLFEALPAEPYYSVNCVDQTLPNHIIDTIFSYLFQTKNVLDGRPIRVQECCGLTGDGVMQGMQWFIEQVSQHNDYSEVKTKEVVNSIQRNGASVYANSNRHQVITNQSPPENRERKHTNMNESEDKNKVQSESHDRDVVAVKKKTMLEPVPLTLGKKKTMLEPVPLTLGKKETMLEPVPLTLDKKESVKDKAKIFSQMGEKDKVELQVVKRKKLKKKSRVAQMGMNFDSVGSLVD